MPWRSNTRTLSRMRACALGLVGLALATTPLRVLALDRDQSLHQLGHRVWGAKDGLFGNVYALAQSKDGFLWVGGSDGLYRFDGVRFKRYAPTSGTLPSLRVTKLFAGADGSLWIGYSSGMITHLSHGNARTFGESDGVPVGRNSSIVEDADGIIWASFTGGFVRFDGTRFVKVRKEWNYPEKTADTTAIDSSGTLWTTLEGRTYYLLRGTHSFQAVPGTTERVVAFVPHGAKIALYTTGDLVRVYLRDCPLYRPLARLYSSHDSLLLEDRDRTVWITAQLGGLQRTGSLEGLAAASAANGDPKDLEAFGRKDGLSGSAPLTALEDQEGSLWVATEQGLDQFTRRNIVARASFPDEWGANVVQGPDGVIWYAPLVSNELKRRTWTRIGDGKRIDKPYPDIGAVHRAQDGTVWFFSAGPSEQGYAPTTKFLSHWTKDGIVEIPLPSKPGEATHVRAITTDLSGNPWVTIPDNGTWRYDGARWHPISTDNHGNDTTGHFAITDNSGSIWILSHDRLVRNTGDALHIVNDANLPSSPFNGMAWSGKEIFISGKDGLSVGGFNGFRKIRLPIDMSRAFALVADTASGVWFAYPKGICHLSVEAIEASRNRPLMDKDIEVFDVSNDLPEALDQSIGDGMASADGRIWFTATTSILEVDPHRVQWNTLAPRVAIESLTTESGPISLQEPLRIAPHAGDLRFTFASLSLRLPEHNLYSYRLRPGSDAWSTPSAEHEAIFGSLSPGKYVLEVRGSNNDGVWSTTPATISFTVLPAFYQTWWFRSFYFLLAGVLLYLAYLIRMRRIVARVRLQAEARFAERERIARDLHDSLLGEVQGLALRVGTIVDLTPDSHHLKEGLERTLKVAEEVMRSGRERVQNLRESTLTGEAFVAQLTDACHRFEYDQKTKLKLDVSGSIPQEVNSVIATEIYRIVTEAVLNAFRHSNSPVVDVSLRFDEHRFAAIVKDQGQGFDTELWKHGSASHFGLAGMQERAREAGAELVLNTSQLGTTITVRIRAKGFYVGRKKSTPPS